MTAVIVLKRAADKCHAHAIADRSRVPVIPGPVSNPTLVAHGLAQRALYHILGPSGQPAADLYGTNHAQAVRIAGIFADQWGAPVKLIENFHNRAADVFTQPSESVGRSRNPMIRYPVKGEVWRGIHGDTCRILEVKDHRVTVLQLGSGNRVTSDLRDFLASYKPPVTPTPNPKGRNNPITPTYVGARSRGDAAVQFYYTGDKMYPTAWYVRFNRKGGLAPARSAMKKVQGREAAEAFAEVFLDGGTITAAMAAAKRIGALHERAEQYRRGANPKGRIPSSSMLKPFYDLGGGKHASAQGWPTRAAALGALKTAQGYDDRAVAVKKIGGWWKIIYQNPGKFTRQPAVIARTAEHYYEFRADGITTIGSRTRDMLVRWARTHGFAPTFVDERKPELRAGVFDTSGHARNPVGYSDQLRRAFGRGTQAAWDGKPMSANPYKKGGLRDAWDNGHRKGIELGRPAANPKRRNAARPAGVVGPGTLHTRSLRRAASGRFVKGSRNPRAPFQEGERVTVPYTGRSKRLTSQHATVLGVEGDSVHVQFKRGKRTETQHWPHADVRRRPARGERAALRRLQAVKGRLELKDLRERHKKALAAVSKATSDLECLEARAKQAQPYEGEAPSADYRRLVSQMRRTEQLLSAERLIANELEAADPAFVDPWATVSNPAVSLLDKAKQTFTMWQDREVRPTLTRMKKPDPLPDVATELGKLVEVGYLSDKYDGEDKIHVHKFDPPYASLVTGPDGRDLHIVRGRSRYSITADGIKR